jgi:HEPN domain-containing protein
MTSDLAFQFAHELIEEAKVDIESSRTHLREGRYHKTIFESQQCVEKLMKAALACEGLTQIYEHDVSGLFASEVVSRAEQTEAEDLREVFRRTMWLFEHYALSRYPIVRGKKIRVPRKEYDKDDGLQAIQEAEYALKIIEQYLRKKYPLLRKNE